MFSELALKFRKLCSICTMFIRSIKIEFKGRSGTVENLRKDNRRFNKPYFLPIMALATYKCLKVHSDIRNFVILSSRDLQLITDLFYGFLFFSRQPCKETPVREVEPIDLNPRKN